MADEVVSEITTDLAASLGRISGLGPLMVWVWQPLSLRLSCRWWQCRQCQGWATDPTAGAWHVWAQPLRTAAVQCKVHGWEASHCQSGAKQRWQPLCRWAAEQDDEQLVSH